MLVANTRGTLGLTTHSPPSGAEPVEEQRLTDSKTLLATIHEQTDNESAINNTYILYKVLFNSTAAMPLKKGYQQFLHHWLWHMVNIILVY